MAKLDQSLITRAALDIIESAEHQELTLSAIARRLEVTQPALYYHVDGIEDVLRWVGMAVRAQLVDVLSASTIGRAGADAVRSVAAAWLQFSKEHPGLYQSTDWYPVEGDPELEAAVGQVLAVIAASLRSFDLTDDQRATCALALRSTLHGFASFERGAGNPSPTTSEESFAQVIDLLITGVESLANS